MFLRTNREVCVKSFSFVPFLIFYLAVFIHSVIFVAIGVFGIACSYALLVGLTKRSTSKILWWICFQGIAVVHQIFFSFEILAIVNRYISSTAKLLVLLVALVLCLYVIMEAYFIRLIVGVYQGIVDEEIANSQPQPAWRIPTVSELLGNECEIGQTTPPPYTFRVNHDSRLGTSDA